MRFANATIFENCKTIFEICPLRFLQILYKKRRELVQIAADNNRDEDSFNSFNKIAILKIKVQMKDL